VLESVGMQDHMTAALAGDMEAIGFEIKAIFRADRMRSLLIRCFRMSDKDLRV
jgi:hypothetical protein